MSTQDPRLGTTLGSYRIDALLGRGGMGVVYRAEDLSPGTRGRRVALKILSPDLAQDPRFRERFQQESQVAASIDHPNIVPIYGAGEAEGMLWIAMRNVEGEDLGTVLRREGALEPSRAIEIIGQVAAALDAAHARGLVHRDVKPGNMLLVASDESSGPPHVYLTDFGLTKRAAGGSGLTVTGQFVGTIDYVAPEQIEGKGVDHRTDIYALGCVLFECLTGTAPYRREEDAAALWAHLTEPPPKVSEARPGIPPQLDDVIARGLAREKDHRYASCRELVAAARAALQGQPVSAPPPAAAPVPPPPVSSYAGTGGAATAPPGIASPVPTAAGTPGVSPPVAQPPARPAGTRGSNRLVLAIVGGLILAAAVGIGIFALAGGDGDDPVDTPTTEPPVAVDYPPEVVQQFVSSCTAEGTSRATCQCALDKFEAKYPLADFQAEALKLTQGTASQEFTADLVNFSLECA